MLISDGLSIPPIHNMDADGLAPGEAEVMPTKTASLHNLIGFILAILEIKDGRLTLHINEVMKQRINWIVCQVSRYER